MKYLPSAIFAVGLFGCDGGENYTLYRNSVAPGGDTMRIHVASFDSNDGNDYNSSNCEIARELFQQQQGVTVRYWCEKGKFKK